MAQQDNGVVLPGDSRRKGAINDTNSETMKNPPKVNEEKLDKGPDIDPETKSYRPASYRTTSGAIRTDN